MNSLLRITLTAVIVALSAMLTTPLSTKAQPCAAITLINTTGFNVTLTLWTVPATPGVTVPANGRLVLPFTPAVNVFGAFGRSGTAYPWAANPVPPPPFWLPSIELLTGAPPPNLCYVLFWDPATCTLTIVAQGVAPCTNP